MGAFSAIRGVYGYPWGRSQISLGRTDIRGMLRLSMGSFKDIGGANGYPWGAFRATEGANGYQWGVIMQRLG